MRVERPSLADVVRFLDFWVQESPEPSASAMLMLGAATGVAVKYIGAARLREVRALRELFESGEL